MSEGERAMSEPDEQIKKNIVDQLLWDSRIDDSEVSLEVNEGTVTLSGRVPTYSDREAIHSDVWSIPGVVSVESHISVDHPTTAVSDHELESRIESLLEWNPAFDGAAIEIAVEQGRVTLRGSVDTMWKKQRAEELTVNLAGVLGVANKLTVVPTKDISDEEIGKEILAALNRKFHENMHSVHVVVANGAVTLSGTVPDHHAHRSVYETAIFTEGVVNIEDNLEISWLPHQPQPSQSPGPPQSKNGE
jgi:osmotically-inducible protein OsmY